MTIAAFILAIIVVLSFGLLVMGVRDDDNIVAAVGIILFFLASMCAAVINAVEFGISMCGGGR